MKILIVTSTLFYASMGFAVGWVEISESKAEDHHIAIKFEYDKEMSCTSVEAAFPMEKNFSDLGGRRLSHVRYQHLAQKQTGWQLAPIGSGFDLSTHLEDGQVRINGLCLSTPEIERGYLYVFYAGTQGQIPMIVLIDLGSFR